jgi:hypothetical protein
MAGDDERDRIMGHGLPHIASRLRPSAQFLRQGSIGGGFAPPKLSDCRVDAFKQWTLLAQACGFRGKSAPDSDLMSAGDSEMKSTIPI